jgi:hypothetical protein
VLDPQLAQQVIGAIRGRRAAGPRPESDVVPDGQVRKQRGVLEDQADAPPLGRQAGDVGSGKADLPGLLRPQPGDGLQQHGLARARWPEHHEHPVGWDVQTAVTAVVMFALAAGKARTGAALGDPVLQTEGRVTLIDGILAAAVLLGLVLNAALGWWWADPAAGYVLVFYAAREVRDIFFTGHPGTG